VFVSVVSILRRVERNFSSDLESLSKAASISESIAHPDLLQTLSKWIAKIDAAAPARSHSFKNSLSHNTADDLRGITSSVQKALEDVPSTVTEDHSGKMSDTATQSIPHQSFDDNAFYKQLLRDIVTLQGAVDSSLPGWPSSNKVKRVAVDTKASKGRKLRYEVHEKLQNFMVPIPVMTGGWHDQQIDDLFLSLAKSDGVPM